MKYPVNDQPTSMTSLEIAELVGSRHDSVKRTIERLSETGVIQLPLMVKVENKQSNSPNRFADVYRFEGDQGKRDSIITVAQLCPEFTARLVDRWQELEMAVNHPIAIPQTLPEALRLAADLAEQKAELENKLAIAAPKADFVDNYVEASGSMGFREVAKLLKVKESDFRLFLVDSGIMYKLAGKLTPYSQHLDAGRFTVKTGENQNNGHAFTQAKFTPKGIQWIAGLLTARRLTEKAA
ncbi:phage antirepressor KilAC domain-containing protein [Serratia sp. UGAL515B_01]|uniref:phage antirepressor KilAC domain-containing protein n=1 Tax=Serratia sp. UGAL515B_01 TaxID=2986763 RepID=UPI0029555921|nr:phage antirepressor KilAC domain-containing protein [Serratia sp. UGAL515B_01]WON77569.1 phage antirepressor KilAC domain-containing protein [Serratia sp. UGAL515B_01]